jgi:hypothetical protein
LQKICVYIGSKYPGIWGISYLFDKTGAKRTLVSFRKAANAATIYIVRNVTSCLDKLQEKRQSEQHGNQPQRAIAWFYRLWPKVNGHFSEGDCGVAEKSAI